MLNCLRTKRIAWYAAASSIPVTAALLAFGGGHLNTFMFWLLTIGFTSTTTGRLWVWWRTRHNEANEIEDHVPLTMASPITGDSRLPSDAFFG